MLVTGAAGMLAHDLIPALVSRGHVVTGVDLDVDVTDQDAVDTCVDAVGPAAIFHLAAWTDVDGAEVEEAACHAVNAAGSANVARAAARVGADLIAISTDYVFAGDAAGGYAEDDPVGPLCAYGRSKLAAERAVLAEHPAGARIARTAWLYGAGGSNFVDTMRTLGSERDEVRVVGDQTGSPTWTADLAPALIALLDSSPGVYHTAGAGSISWAGLAEAVFAEAGIECRVVPITTAQLGRPAPRPAVSVLRTTRPGAPRLRHWRPALHDYIGATAAVTTARGR